MKTVLTILLLSSVLFSSCRYISGEKIQGDGHIVQQERAITGFSSVHVSSAIKVVLKQDSAFSIQVETDNNLQPYIEVYKEADVLYVCQQRNTSLRSNHDITVYISAPVYREISVSGASSISGQSTISLNAPFYIEMSGASKADLIIKAPATKVNADGASYVKLEGQTRDLEVDGDGASEIHLFGLLAENTQVDIDGASTAEVHASVRLDVEASGASKTLYKEGGNFVAHTSGASSVTKVN